MTILTPWRIYSIPFPKFPSGSHFPEGLKKKGGSVFLPSIIHLCGHSKTKKIDLVPTMWWTLIEWINTCTSNRYRGRRWSLHSRYSRPWNETNETWGCESWWRPYTIRELFMKKLTYLWRRRFLVYPFTTDVLRFLSFQTSNKYDPLIESVVVLLSLDKSDRKRKDL